MLDAAVVRRCSPTLITGWGFEARDGQPRVCASNGTHAEKKTGNHQVFNTERTLPKLGDIHDLKRALTDAGVL